MKLGQANEKNLGVLRKRINAWEKKAKRKALEEAKTEGGSAASKLKQIERHKEKLLKDAREKFDMLAKEKRGKRSAVETECLRNQRGHSNQGGPKSGTKKGVVNGQILVDLLPALKGREEVNVIQRDQSSLGLAESFPIKIADKSGGSRRGRGVIISRPTRKGFIARVPKTCHDGNRRFGDGFREIGVEKGGQPVGVASPAAKDDDVRTVVQIAGRNPVELFYFFRYFFSGLFTVDGREMGEKLSAKIRVFVEIVLDVTTRLAIGRRDEGHGPWGRKIVASFLSVVRENTVAFKCRLVRPLFCLMLDEIADGETFGADHVTQPVIAEKNIAVNRCVATNLWCAGFLQNVLVAQDQQLEISIRAGTFHVHVRGTVVFITNPEYVTGDLNLFSLPLGSNRFLEIFMKTKQVLVSMLFHACVSFFSCCRGRPRISLPVLGLLVYFNGPYPPRISGVILSFPPFL